VKAVGIPAKPLGTPAAAVRISIKTKNLTTISSLLRSSYERT
jgi:hypothetical protein